MSMRKGRQSPKTAILPNRPAGRTRRGPGNHTTAFEKACSLQIRRTVGHPRLRFWWKRNPISISESVFLPLPSSSLSFHGWGKHFLIWTWRAFFTSLIQTKRGVNIGRLKDDFQVLATPCVQYKIWKAAGMTKGGFLSCTEKLRGIIDRYVFFIISLFLLISSLYLYISNWERKSRWILSPISNTKSYLLIERSSSNTGLCLFFFLVIPHIQRKQLTTSTPPHTTSWGGWLAVRLLNQTKSVVGAE